MTLAELGLEIYIVMLCLNAGILIVGETMGVDLISPFDNSTVTGITTGVVTDIANYTTNTGLTQNLTSGTLLNDTIGGSGDLNPVNSIFFPLTVIWTFIQFITGGFVFQVLGIIGLPDIFIFSMQAIIGVLFARLIIYYVWGR